MVRLTVLGGSDTPYRASGDAYKRSHTSTVKADSADLKRLVMRGLNLPFEEAPAPDQRLTFDILDGQLAEQLGLDSVDEKVYRTLELSSAALGFNNAAAVFADDNRFPGVDIVRFGDTINELMDRQTTEHVSALKLYDDAMVMFDRYYKYEEIDGAQRRTRCLVPENAYREAIANALVHRDWTVRAMVKVACFADRIEISSPGGLPSDVSEEDYLGGHLSVLRNPIIGGVLSVLRNPIIGEVFARLGYIELFGTGIPRVKAAYDGCARKPRFVITANSITVCLPVVSTEARLDAQERAIVDLLNERGPLGRVQIEEALRIGRKSALRSLKKLA